MGAISRGVMGDAHLLGRAASAAERVGGPQALAACSTEAPPVDHRGGALLGIGEVLGVEDLSERRSDQLR